MATGTNGIATCKNLYDGGGYLTVWQDNLRCPTREEAAPYLGITATPATKCFKYSAWTTKTLSKTPTYSIVISSDGTITDSGTLNKLNDSFGDVYFDAYYQTYTWDPNLGDDVNNGISLYPNGIKFTGTANAVSVSITTCINFTGYNTGYLSHWATQTKTITTTNGYKYNITLNGDSGDSGGSDTESSSSE